MCRSRQEEDSQRFRAGFGWQKFGFFGRLGGASAEVIEILDGAIEVTAHACVVAVDEIEVRAQALDGGTRGGWCSRATGTRLRFSFFVFQFAY